MVDMYVENTSMYYDSIKLHKEIIKYKKTLYYGSDEHNTRDILKYAYFLAVKHYDKEQDLSYDNYLTITKNAKKQVTKTMKFLKNMMELSQDMLIEYKNNVDEANDILEEYNSDTFDDEETYECLISIAEDELEIAKNKYEHVSDTFNEMKETVLPMLLWSYKRINIFESEIEKKILLFQ